MMLVPDLLLEELLDGYRGRLRFLNDLRDRQAVTATLNGLHIGHDGHQARERSFVELVAKYNRRSIHHVVMHHSLWPFTAAIGRPNSVSDIERLADQQAGRTAMMRSARPDAWLCPKCVAEDLAFWGASYWRRSHQLPGVLWCDKHHNGLRRANLNELQAGPPDHCLENAEPLDTGWIESLRSNSIIQRFLDICAGILESGAPLDKTHCTHSIVLAAVGAGLCSRSQDVGRALFDLACSQLPVEWCCSAFPRINWTRATGTAMIDAACRVQYPTSTAAIAFVGALVFRSADNALNALAPGQLLNDAPSATGPLSV